MVYLVNASIITTFDLRMTRPNMEPVMNTAEIHTIEHLGATYLRNHPNYGNRVIYFGPMGCRTGFYLLLAGDFNSEGILPLVREMFEFIRDYEGEIPGATPRNYTVSAQRRTLRTGAATSSARARRGPAGSPAAARPNGVTRESSSMSPSSASA